MAQGMAGQGGTRPAFIHPVVEPAGMMHDVHMKGLMQHHFMPSGMSLCM